jgi:cell wall-associated NlpC family hydrolase
LVNWNVADLFREPRPLAERVTQALLGEASRVLEETESGWLHVRLERDGYLGWMRPGSLFSCDEAGAQSYLAAADGLVVAGLASAYARKPGGSEEKKSIRPAGQLPLGVTLPTEDQSGDYVALRLPDGHLWWAARADLLPVARHPKPDPAGIIFALDIIRRLVGVPYLWGGRSPFGYDCSGLAQALWGLLGVRIPRDADQQFRSLPPVLASTAAAGEPHHRRGDLLYFGEPNEDDTVPDIPRISHVAISLGGADVIHANVAAGGISHNSLDPASPRYRPWLRQHLAGVRRPGGRAAAAQKPTTGQAPRSSPRPGHGEAR